MFFNQVCNAYSSSNRLSSFMGIPCGFQKAYILSPIAAVMDHEQNNLLSSYLQYAEHSLVPW